MKRDCIQKIGICILLYGCSSSATVTVRFPFTTQPFEKTISRTLESGTQAVEVMELCGQPIDSEFSIANRLTADGFVVQLNHLRIADGWHPYGIRFRKGRIYGDIYSESLMNDRRNKPLDGLGCRIFTIRFQYSSQVQVPDAWLTPYAREVIACTANPKLSSTEQALASVDCSSFFSKDPRFLFREGTY